MSIFCKRVPFNATFEFFHYIIVLDNSRFTQTFIYHLTSCDKSRFSVVVRNFAFKNNSMNNPHNIFLKISNLGFVRQRHWQKSWECQWVGLRMIGACLMNGLSTVADTRASQPIFGSFFTPSQWAKITYSTGRQARSLSCCPALQKCITSSTKYGRHFVSDLQ